MAVIKTLKDEVFTAAVMREAIKAGAAQVLREVQNRTVDGFNNRAQKFRPLRPSTIRSKARNISRGKYRGRFAATSATQVARATGQSLRDLKITGVRASKSSIGVSGGFELAITTARSNAVIGYLAEQGRPILGLCPASTARGAAERKRVLDVMRTVLATRGRGGTIVVRPV